jgi:hypothetical protein
MVPVVLDNGHLLMFFGPQLSNVAAILLTGKDYGSTVVTKASCKGIRLSD